MDIEEARQPSATEVCSFVPRLTIQPECVSHQSLISSLGDAVKNKEKKKKEMQYHVAEGQEKGTEAEKGSEYVMFPKVGLY